MSNHIITQTLRAGMSSIAIAGVTCLILFIIYSAALDHAKKHQTQDIRVYTCASILLTLVAITSIILIALGAGQ